MLFIINAFLIYIKANRYSVEQEFILNYKIYNTLSRITCFLVIS